MATIQQPFVFDDFSGGMIDDTSVSDALLPRNAVRRAVNAVFDRPRGALSQRYGSVQVGNTLNGGVYGTYNFRTADGSINRLLAAANNGGTSSVYYLTGGNTFSSTLTGDTISLPVRFITFLNTVVRLNGTDAAKSWTGILSDSWLVSGGPLDIGNWPSATKFAVPFNSRIYTCGVTTTVYFSAIETGGAISWTSGNGSINVNKNDGDGGFTGMGTNGRVILLFKRNSMYRWDGQSVYANRIINIGTASHDSIVPHDSGFVYFHGLGRNTVGFFRTTGGYPQNISRPIKKWLAAIPASKYPTISGFADEDHIYWSVGDVTVNGQTYSNAWYVYTVSLQSWHIESRAHSFNSFSTYVDTSSNLTIVGGDSAGNVHTINSGNDDLGTPISAEVDLHPYTFTTRAHTKAVPRINCYYESAQGLTVFMKADANNYRELGTLKGTDQPFTAISNTDSELIRGKRIFVKLAATNSSDPWQFDGIEFNDVNDEGYYDPQPI